MAVPTVAWSEATPPGAEAIATGDDRIREMKTQLREIIDVDHEHENAGSDTDWGMHKTIHLINEAGAPGLDAAHGQLYQRDDAGAVKELFFKDPAANDIQITNDGVLVPGTNSVATADIQAGAVSQAGFAQASTLQTTALDVYGDLDSMSVAITTTGGVGVLIDFMGEVPEDAAVKAGCYIILDVDGGNEATSETRTRTHDCHNRQNISMHFFKTGLGAALHTFKIQWKRDTAEFRGRMEQRTLRVVELKR